MANPTAFKTVARAIPAKRPVQERLRDYNEIYVEQNPAETSVQAARCMDCGVPFCHSGCPLGNIIPDFNDAVYREDWREAFEILSETNNFPEFTGRICPAPCESACVLGINADPVTIEFIERGIAEEAYRNGWAKPQLPLKPETGRRVAIVGSGPAGLAAAEQLRKAGHSITVFERNDRIGGLLRYGIPDFKLEKQVIDRKLALMEAAGIKFRTSVNVGVDLSVDELRASYDAVLLTGGATLPRDLPIPGRQLKGVHYAMDFLERQNRDASGAPQILGDLIHAGGKHVIVIGGGDTGADCVGTSNRHVAASVTQIELLVKPPDSRDASTPWPNWPMQLRTSTSHEEGCDRQWALLTKAFVGNDAGEVTGLTLVNIEWTHDAATGRSGFTEVPGTERTVPCDLALLAVGFVSPQREGLLDQLGVAIDNRGNVDTRGLGIASQYATSEKGVFAAGDMRRGQSLVVWAIAEGREAAVEVDEYLSGGKRSILRKQEQGRMLV